MRTMWLAVALGLVPVRDLPNSAKIFVDPLRLDKALAGVPATFVANQGQWAHPARYVLALRGAEVLLDRAGWLLALHDPTGTTGAAVRMRFANGGESEPQGEQPRGRTAYLRGCDPAAWHSSVGRFAAVRYVQPWPGIDVVGRVEAGSFEYDLEVAAGAALAAAAIEVEGAQELRLEADGSLRIATAAGEVSQPPPLAWQLGRDGQRLPRRCRFRVLDPRCFGFVVDQYDPALELVIDPPLHYATFLGGNGNDTVHAMVIEASGLVVLTGPVTSTNFPTSPGAYDTTLATKDTYVALLDLSLPPAQQLRYSTYLGGNGIDVPWAVAVASNGVITVAGQTDAPDFPITPGAFDPTANGGASDGFVASLDPSQTGPQQLVYGSYLGGSGSDIIRAMQVSASGLITVCGYTTSADLPTSPNAYDVTVGQQDVFVASLDPSQPAAAQLQYSTYFGGSFVEFGYALGIDPSGQITLGGWTASPDMPVTTGAYDRTFNGGQYDALLARLDPSLAGAAQLVYATYLGGATFPDGIDDLVVDGIGRIVATGFTGSADFPTTPTGYDRSHNGANDAIVVRIDPALLGSAQLDYSTFLGGTMSDGGNSVFVEADGVVAVAGQTGSSGFPTSPGTYDPTTRGGVDGFVVRLDLTNAGAAQLVFGTFLGGGDGDAMFVVASSPNDILTVAGETKSVGFPVTANAYDPTFEAGQEAVLVQFTLAQAVLAGQGCGVNGSPMLTVALPRIARPQALALGGASANVPLSLLLALGPPAPVGVGACTIEPDLSNPVMLPLGATDAQGAWSGSLGIPSDGNLVGGIFTMQMVTLVTNGPALGVAELSNGVQARVGY